MPTKTARGSRARFRRHKTVAGETAAEASRPGIKSFKGLTMSSIPEKEKKHLINTSFSVDEVYIRELDKLRENLTRQGLDIETPEGRKIFVKFLRRLNSRFV